MDIPYKGYTIVPNSERQPDGRWLPMAELEVSDRGVVTADPPASSHVAGDTGNPR
jgi:hypothetical protein